MNGKNNNLRCSQMLSFTGVNNPMNWLFPDSSNKKCPTTPIRLTVKKPIRLLQKAFSFAKQISPPFKKRVECGELRVELIRSHNIYDFRDKIIFRQIKKSVPIFYQRYGLFEIKYNEF